MTLLSVVTASNSATVDIETTFDSTYDVYLLTFNAVIPASDSDLYVRMKIGGSYQASGGGYYQAGGGAFASTTAWQNGSLAAQDRIRPTFGTTVGGDAAEGVDGRLWIFSPSIATRRQQILFESTFITPDADLKWNAGSGVYMAAAGALTGIRFLMSSGNISSGTFRLYGLQKTV